MRFNSLRLPIKGYPNTAWFTQLVHEYQSVEVRFSAKPGPGGLKYRKIPKISPWLIFFKGPFWRGLSTEGNLRFKIDWASLIVGRKFTGFALFYFVFEGNFQVQASWGGGGGLHLKGLIHGGAFFRNFTVTEDQEQSLV